MNTNLLPPPLQAMRIMTGHWVAQIAATFARLELPDHIARGVTGSEALAAAVGASPDGVHRLLRAATTAGLAVEPSPRNFQLTPVGECLRSGVPGSIRDLMIAELAPGHWLPWGHLTEAVRSGKPVAERALGMDAWSYYGKNREEGAYFARGMGNMSAMIVEDCLDACDYSKYARIVDVGGSQGGMLAGVLRAAPASRGVLFDRADVIEGARKTVAGYDVKDRIECVAGDFFVDVPTNGDLYILKWIIHDWDDEQSTRILQAVHRASKTDSRLHLVEMLLPTGPMEPGHPVGLMDINMLVMLGGRERNEPEFTALLARAGWKLTRVVPTRGLASIIEAVRA